MSTHVAEPCPENVKSLFLQRVRGTGYGAFMEPSGRNRWQPVANAQGSKTAMVRSGSSRCRREEVAGAHAGGPRGPLQARRTTLARAARARSLARPRPPRAPRPRSPRRAGPRSGRSTPLRRGAVRGASTRAGRSPRARARVRPNMATRDRSANSPATYAVSSRGMARAYAPDASVPADDRVRAWREGGTLTSERSRR
jgi:hypothetical protein